MKIKTSELTGAALDWAVAKCENDLAIYDPADLPEKFIRMRAAGLHNYSTDWSQGGPIIEREGIGVLFDSGSACRKPSWFATPDSQGTSSSYEGEVFDPAFMVDEKVGVYGPTPLIAAMRCYVAFKLGDEVDVPEELLS